MNAEPLSPKEFLRARHPESFSDSLVGTQPTLDRSMLEYHLETITSRNQEMKFATFARHLAEREICPNLLPQTGPTGGGDSKVDAETFPVADDLAIGWYTGIGREAASERWGFAFSAKKNWRDKVRSDIAKLVETKRDYRRAFFLSNQFIPDKARAQVEDELRATHDIDLRILDRTWILDRVFTKGHETLAIEDLELSATLRKHVIKGPRDTQREQELARLEERIQKSLQEQDFGFQLVEDCIDVGDLARQLERPRTETEGMFARAERIAAKYGNDHQILKCAYEKASTTYWWHEDLEQFAREYSNVEEAAKGTRNVYHLELLTRLWCLLHSAVTGKALDAAAVDYARRTGVVTQALEGLTQDEAQPSACLQAQTLLLLIEFHKNLAANKPLDKVLRGLGALVCKCEGLVGYPLEPVAAFVIEAGKTLQSVPAYDTLFETVVKVTSRRKGEVSAARMLVARGEQLLILGKPYESIRTIGPALFQLYKHESRHDEVRGLYFCGCAYERVGLLWAARGTILMAASLAAADMWTYGTPSQGLASCCRRLKWLELQLGRLPQLLAWHEADTAVRRVLAADAGTQEEVSDEARAFDMNVGTLLLKTDFWELKWLSALPDVLEMLGLTGAAVALLYALGYEEEFQNAGERGRVAEEDLHATALEWRTHPASRDLPPKPLLYETCNVELKSSILGCEITVKSENVEPCLEVAESVLAACESVLATGTVELIVSREPVLTMSVRKSDFAKFPFDYELQEVAGRPHLKIECPDLNPHRMETSAQTEVKKRINQVIATVIARCMTARDLEAVVEKLMREDRASERSLSFTGSFVTVGNVLGYNPKNQVSSWTDPQARQYPLKRSAAWDAGDSHSDEGHKMGVNRAAPTPGIGEEPEDLVNRGRTKHSQIRNVSLIRESLWDKAGWSATAFLTGADESSPPVLAPVFRDMASAKQIFESWRSDVGIRDVNERLRVAIVRGIDKTRPFSYRVLMGSNPSESFSNQDVRYTVNMARMHTMDARSDENFERFLRSYRKTGTYFIAPAFAKNNEEKPEVIENHYIIKNELYVRQAFEIGRHDPDFGAIDGADSPIIPPGCKDAPVLELIQWIRKQETSAQSALRDRKGKKIGRNALCPCGSGEKYKRCHGL